METIIVELMLAATGEYIEFMLPAHVPLGSLMDDMAQLIERLNMSVAFDREDIILFDLDRSIVMQPEWTPAQNGLHDSSRLMIL